VTTLLAVNVPASTGPPGGAGFAILIAAPLALLLVLGLLVGWITWRERQGRPPTPHAVRIAAAVGLLVIVGVLVGVYLWVG
jgi:uncharacterized iron-regulated membrane protein